MDETALSPQSSEVHAPQADPDETTIEPTRGGSWTIRHRGLTLASCYDPMAEARDLIADLDRDARWILLFGLGTGHLARAILERCPRARLIVCEPSRSVFEAVRSCPALWAELTQERIHLDTDCFPLRLLFEQHYVPGEPIRSLILPAYRRLYAVQCQSFFETLLQSRRRVEANYVSRLAVGGVWAAHLLRNIPALHRTAPVDRLKDLFAGVPAICVAAGPSLSRNIGDLVPAQSRAVILGVGTSLLPLRKVGITPHFGIAIEWRDAVLRQFEGIDLASIHLVLSGLSHPHLYEKRAAGAFAELPTGSPACEWVAEALGHESLFAEGGSVAHAAFSTAWLLGCDPIILIGQDLALGPDRRTHSDLSIHGALRAGPADSRCETHFGQGTYSLPGYHGGRVETLREFYCYHAWFEDRVRLADGQRTLINATEGGACIRGMIQMPLSEAVEHLPALERDPREMIASVREDYRRPDATALVARLRLALSEIRLCAEAANEGSRLCWRLSRTEAVERSRAKLLGRLEAIDERLKNLLGRNPFIQTLTAPAMYRYTRAEADGPPEDEARAFEWSLKLTDLLYQAIGASSAELIPLFEKTQRELEEPQAETSA